MKPFLPKLESTLLGRLFTQVSAFFGQIPKKIFLIYYNEMMMMMMMKRKIMMNLHCRFVSLFALLDRRADEEDDFFRIDLSGSCRV